MNWNNLQISDLASVPYGRYMQNVSFPVLPGCGVWYAGGCVRDSLLGIPYRDIDVWAKTKTELENFRDTYLAPPEYQWAKIYESDLIQTFRSVAGAILQLHFREWRDIADCLNDFDFTICQFAFDGTNLYFPVTSLGDLLKRRLVLHRYDQRLQPRNIYRTLKMVRRGFTYDDDSYWRDMPKYIRGFDEKQMEDFQDNNYAV